jgi:hypothetical protein
MFTNHEKPSVTCCITLMRNMMVQTERAASHLVLRKLCSILFFNVLFLTLLAQKILSVITFMREEILDIRATSTYQHYEQGYDFPEADPLTASPGHLN